MIQTNETKKSTQIDAFFESKPRIDAFLKIDANAQRQEYKMASRHQRFWKQDVVFNCSFSSLRLVDRPNEGGRKLFRETCNKNIDKMVTS